MVREKTLSIPDLSTVVEEILSLTKSFNATLSVNGNINVARAADGVHVQAPDCFVAARDALPPPSLIGISAHSIKDIEHAAAKGFDYATISPIFQSISKPDYDCHLGVGIFEGIHGIDIPVVALGGITPLNAPICLDAGASGVAVMGSIMNSHQPGKSMAELIASIRRG